MAVLNSYVLIMVLNLSSGLSSKILDILHIRCVFTTPYHPEANGQTERANQEVEQYLRLFCSKRQDDWVDLLPTAEFVLNSRLHSAHNQMLFEVLYGYRPDFTIPIGSKSNIPALNVHIEQLKEAQKEA